MKFAALSVMVILVLAAANSRADNTIHKCLINGKTVLQSEPCTQDTVAQHLAKQKQQIEEIAERSETRRREAERKKLADESRDRLRLNRLEQRPYDSLSALERAEVDLVRAQRESAELDRRNADGTAQREFNANAARYCTGIQIGKVFIGMTEDQLLHCTEFRKPSAVNRLVTKDGVRKQYVFDKKFYYFRNGKLESWQD